jgi:hypothetical protein
MVATRETVRKSRQKIRYGVAIPQPMESDDDANSSTFFADVSEDKLVRELARRKTDRY